MKKKHLPVFAIISLLLVNLSFHSRHTEKSLRLLQHKDTTAPFSIEAKDHLGKSVVSVNGVITFTTGLDNDFYPVDSPGKTARFYIEAKLARFVNNSIKRIPLNICVVIDRSGSMQGTKMGFAKKAARNIIDQLGPEDIVSVVIYDNAVDTIQPPVNVTDRQKIKAKIDLISPRGSTNLWGGTEQGYQFVQRNYQPGYINRVLLISDGLANVGLTDSTLVRLKVQKYKDDEGISLSTFGVGLDYNETLMTDMAETGAGNYYFIDAPEKMTSIFANELNGLMNVAAQNAELRIQLPKGVTIIKAYPFRFQQSGNEITIKLRDLSSEETRAGLFTLAIENGVNEVLKFTSTLSYTDAAEGSTKQMTNVNTLAPVRNIDAYLTHFNRQVMEQTILYTANERLETAMNLMENGDYTEAKEFLDRNSEYLKSNAAYVRSNKALGQMDSVNNTYGRRFEQAKAVSTDSAKRVQKASKAINYRIRNKKQ